jgi:hypothetical protein
MTPVDLSTLQAFWSVWKKVWGVLGPAGNLLQWTYNINARFHLAIRRSWYWITNATAHWNASFDFGAPEAQIDLASVLNHVVVDLSSQQGFQVLRDTPESKIVRARGIVFDLSCHTGTLHVQVADQTVSYRDSQRIIGTQILPVVERIEQSLPAAKRRYALTAHFGSDENPYLSVYLRRIDKSLISTFECSYNLAEEGVTVSVNLESINVIAESRESFREASAKLLALSRP